MPPGGPSPRARRLARALLVASAGLLFPPALLRSALGDATAPQERRAAADPDLGAARRELGVEPAPAAPPPPARGALPPAPPGAPLRVALFAYDRVAPHLPAGLEMEAAEEFATDNFGNLLWKYAAPRLLPPDTELLYYEPGAGDVSAMRPAPAALLMPEANIFYNASLVEGEPMYAGLLPEARAATRGLLDNVRNVDVPLLVIGSGRCSLDKRRLVESAI
jgi:hypothetical protein